MSDHIEALFIPYTLGLLNEDERQVVERYVAQNPAAEQRLMMLLDEMLDDFEAEPAGIAPSPASKTALMARVTADAKPAATPVAQQRSPFSMQAWLRSFFTPPTLSVGFAAAVIITLLTFQLFTANSRLNDERMRVTELEAENEQLASDLDAAETALINTENELLNVLSQQVAIQDSLVQVQQDLDDEAIAHSALQERWADQVDVVGLLQSEHVHTIELQTTEVDPFAKGQLVLEPESHVAILVVSSLASLAEGKEYQIWLINDEGPAPAETFKISSNGQDLVVIRAASTIVSGYSALGITVEPAGGSPEPTSDLVLWGELP